MRPHRRTLADVLRSHARARGDAIALVDGDTALSWRAADQRTSRVAHALLDAGVGAGDRVLWLGQNSIRLYEMLLACCKIGAQFCPANWRQNPHELAFVIDDLAPALVVWQREEVGESVAAGRTLATMPSRWICHDDGEYEAWVAAVRADAPDPDADLDDDQPLLLVYTAAFDGRPNAAMLPSRALIAQGLLMAPWSGIDDAYVFLNSGPLFHIGTFMPNLSTFVMGGANVFIRRSDGLALCEAIDRHRCTGGFIIGPMVDAIVDANADSRFDLSSLRGRSGNPTYDAWVQPNDSLWGRNAGGYGQSEVMGMATFNLLGVDGIGTHGRTSPLLDLRVVDEDDHPLDPGEVGEIAIRGVTVMCGYWNRFELNAHRARNGWHHTNDLGRFEADGTFTFVGPKGRMLKSAAENIYPVEIENCLQAHPAVAQAAVIGVPDSRWVQAVKAIVVVETGHDVTPEILIEHCRSNIASYKKPKYVEFVAELPRAGFAIDYDALDAEFGGGNYPGGTTRSA